MAATTSERLIATSDKSKPRHSRGIAPAVKQARIGRPLEVSVVDVPRMLARYETSNEFAPSEIGVQSAKVCDWRCPAGADHSYVAKAESVFKSPLSACPFCSGRKLSITNRLDVLYPEIASEWDVDLNDGPPAVVSTSSKSAWWRCATCDHRWSTRISRRTREGTGCPKCAGIKNAARMSGTSWGRKPMTTIADVPHMAVRYSPENELPADQVAARSTTVRKWQCPEGADHVYETRPATVFNIASSGCPFCARRELSVTNSLTRLHPELAAEWDTARNGGPPSLVATSAQAVWWRCASCSHSWETTVRHRALERGSCPQCSRRGRASKAAQPRPGRSLVEVAPSVAASWHPTKNAPLGPEDVAAMSNTSRWWLCDYGHEWETAPAHRSSKRRSGCPFCTGRRVSTESSLAVRYPEIAKEWHPTLNGALTPEMVMPSTGKKIWWRCSAGHDYESLPGNRTKNGNGCAYCAGLQVGYGNDLVSMAPEVASQWDVKKNHPIKPDEVTAGGTAKYWWLCVQGHSWETTATSRVRLATGCPQCWSGWRRSLPEIALQYELERLLPFPVFGDSEVRTPTEAWHVDVLCTGLRIIVEYDGSYWHRDGLQRDLRKTQDLMSAGWIVIRVRQAPLQMVGRWDVLCEKKDPDVFTMTVQVLGRILEAAEAATDGHPAKKDLDVLRMSARAYEKGGAAQALDAAKVALADGRINRPRPISVRLPRPPKPGQSLAEKSPMTAAEWHPELNGPLTALDVANGRNSKAWWLCSLCDGAWEANVNGRTRVHSVGCPDCARKRSSLPRQGQSLADLHPEIAAEWHPARNYTLLPGDVKPGSNQRVWWRCSLCDNEWETAISTRMKHKNVGCPTCGWARRGVGHARPKPGQALADLFPEVAKQWHPTKNGSLRPGDVKPRSNKHIWWLCKEDHEWRTSIDCRTRSRPTWCPSCRKNPDSNMTPMFDLDF